jgi:myo-inositol-1(or 4)-monophosphatase
MIKIDRCLAKCRRPNHGDILITATRAALQAGAILRDLYGKPLRIRHKGNIDLVTEADLAAEEAILEILHKDPHDADILSEESDKPDNLDAAGAVWIVDPLDGTTNFAHNFPWFGVSIAYLAEGKSLAGVIYCPLQDELFCACQGAGAWLNNHPIQVSRVKSCQDALVATGFPYDIQARPDEIMAALKAVIPKVQGIRRPGAAALDLAYLACGRLDAFWEVGLKPWDTAAGQLLVEEAGGAISDFHGEPFSPFIPELLASNGPIHRQLIEILKNFSSF